MDFNRRPVSRHRSSVWRIARACLSMMASLLTTGPSPAAEFATTTPRGIYTVKIAGTTEPAAPARTYLGIQLLPDRRFEGIVTNVSGNNLSLQFIFNHADLANGTTKFYVHVLTGSGRGFITDIQEFRAAEIVCSESLTPWLKPGDKIRIRPHSLLSDLFGTENRFGLGSGTDADSADNVVIWDPEIQKERVYYFQSDRNRWEERDIEADASNAILRFPYGFYIVRRSPGTMRISLAGEIGADAILLPVRTAANVFSLPLNLSASLDQLVRADGPFSVVSGPNAKFGDLLTFEEPATGTQRGPFYHLSRPDASGWREVGVDDSSASVQPLDLLSTLILRREGEPGHVLIEGSMDPPLVPQPVLPADPEPGEIPLTGELRTSQLHLPPSLEANVTVVTEISTDLSSWTLYTLDQPVDGVVRFSLPAGQGRFFYRLKVTSN
jgi:hypothetical protein